MKQQLLSILILLAYSCKEDLPTAAINSNEQIVPARYLLKSTNTISINNDTVFLKGEKYNGFLYQLSPNGNDTIAVEGYVNGLLSGDQKKWFPNKQIMEDRYYRQGKKNGKQIAYWPNGNKRFEFVAKDDGYEGELKEWSVNGHLFHLANFVNGQEEGAQKMWYDNGKIRANYVIIQGKRYGLLGTKNCKNVSDSIFVVK
jgi:antitoxin component YwqK of YwqJK toxin-antitoxin module